MINKSFKIIKENNLDAILITSRENIGYLSGFWGSSAALLITKDEGFLFTDFRYEQYARESVFGYNIIIIKF